MSAVRWNSFKQVQSILWLQYGELDSDKFSQFDESSAVNLIKTISVNLMSAVGSTWFALVKPTWSIKVDVIHIH